MKERFQKKKSYTVSGGLIKEDSDLGKKNSKMPVSLRVETQNDTTYGMRVESAKFIYNQVRVDSQEYRQIQNANMLGIDDLGEEETILLDYGNRIAPVIDILSYRYNRMLFTMVTTNLTPPQIRTVYGVRIADRFNEMMLVLHYKSPSFRTPQPNAANAEKQ